MGSGNRIYLIYNKMEVRMRVELEKCLQKWKLKLNFERNSLLPLNILELFKFFKQNII